MSRRRIRQDLDHLTSALLLAVTVAAIVTGVVAHVWDLDEFRYHVWAGYALTGFAALHVALNWGQLTRYARFRLRSRPRLAAASRGARRPPPAPQADGRARRGVVVSRRGLLGLVAGGAIGVLGSRAVPGGPAPLAGSDIALTYHEWSKPGLDDALGTLVSWGTSPPLYKAYPGVEVVALPRPAPVGGMTLEEALRTRRSVREHAGGPMALGTLSQLLALSAGLREGDRRRPHRRRARCTRSRSTRWSTTSTVCSPGSTTTPSSPTGCTRCGSATCGARSCATA